MRGIRERVRGEGAERESEERVRGERGEGTARE